MKNKYVKSAALILALAGVSACTPSIGVNRGADVQKRNVVNHLRLMENIDISHSTNGLNAKAKEQISMFLRVNQVGYGDTLSLDIGEQANAIEKRATVRKYLLSLGFSLEEHAPITGAMPKLDHGILIVDRFIVTPPNCHSSFTQGNSIPITVNSPSFGCSTQVNLGLMVANPQDLVAPQQTGPTNAEVSKDAITSYRNGAPPKGTQIASPLSGDNK